MAKIHKELKRLRFEKGLTLKQLAVIVDSSTSYLSQVERGISGRKSASLPSPKILRLLAKALDANYNELMELAYGEEGDEPMARTREDWEKLMNLPVGDQVKMHMQDLLIEQFENQKSVNEYCKMAYEITKSKGFYDTPRETGTVLALIHSEVSEALEADRKGDTEGFIEELADICIRVFTLCGEIGIDLDGAIREKMEKNKKREYKHGGKAY